jgi:hypothetical protein
MKDITQKVLDVIKDQKPKSKLIFVVKEYYFWAMAILSIVIGALSTSVIIYMLINNNWNLYNQISGNFVSFLFATMPYFWIIVLVFLVFVSFYSFKKTKNGYHYKLVTVILGSILVSIILGVVFYFNGMGRIVDNTFAEKLSTYRQFASPQRKIWSQPEKGFLVGKIIEVENLNFILIDLKHQKWTVERHTSKYIPRQHEIVKIIGTKLDNNYFQAKRIILFDKPQNKMIPSGLKLRDKFIKFK